MDRSIRSPVLRRLLVVAGLGLVAASNTAFALEPCGTGMYPFPYTDVAAVPDPRQFRRDDPRPGRDSKFIARLQRRNRP